MKYLVAVFLCFASMLAFALPSPNDVDAAYNSGNYSKAESMLNEVMKEHPSAKAHFRLGEVYMRENRHKESLNEFRQAQVLDPSLKFVKSAEIFNRLLTNEQAIVTGAGSVAAPTVETQLAVVQAKSAIQEQHDNHVLLIVFGLFVLVALAIGIVLWISSINEKRKMLLEAENERQLKASTARDQLAALLDLNNRLNDADLIRKTATYDDDTKARIGIRIKSLITTIVDLVAGAKKGTIVGDSRLATLSRNVSEMVEAADTGIYAAIITPTPAPVIAPTPAQHAPSDDYDAPSYHRNFVPPRQMPPATPPAGWREQQPQTVVVQSGNNDLLTGMLIGDALSSHRRYEDDVVVHRTVVEDEPVRSSKSSRSRSRDDDDSSSSSSSSSSWSDNSSTDSSSSSSWSDNSSSDSSSGGSSSSDW